MVARLKDPATRARVLAEMRDPDVEWEDLRLLAGSDERLILIEFHDPALKPLTGRTLAEVARERGTSGEETVLDLIVEDDSRAGAAYFLMSEDNVERGLSQPWVRLGSDAESSAPEGVFLKSSTHPRSPGNVARFLGHYVRDRGLLPLAADIPPPTGVPAAHRRVGAPGCLAPA